MNPSIAGRMYYFFRPVTNKIPTARMSDEIYGVIAVPFVGLNCEQIKLEVSKRDQTGLSNRCVYLNNDAICVWNSSNRHAWSLPSHLTIGTCFEC
jgi:hypothetical protein